MHFVNLKLAGVLALPVVVALSSGAVAQNAWVEITDEVLVSPFGVTADTLEDFAVVGADGNKLGEVEEVVGRDAGTPIAIVVDFEDSPEFAARGDVIIPLDQFELGENNLRLNADAAMIGGGEVYSD